MLDTGAGRSCWLPCSLQGRYYSTTRPLRWRGIVRAGSGLCPVARSV